jgi:hypothetical protein
MEYPKRMAVTPVVSTPSVNTRLEPKKAIWMNKLVFFGTN